MTPTLEELVSQMIDRTSHITIVDGAGGVFEGRRVKLNDLRELHLAIRSALDQALAMQRGEDQLDVQRLDYMIAEECQIWEVNGRYSVHAVTEHHPITKEFSTAREAIDAAIRALKKP